MITVYHASMTRSVRVLWLLEELGLPYEVVTLDFMAGDLQKPAYLAKNPLGRVPALEDGDVLVYESGAIVEWLCERYDTAHLLAPAPGTAARARFLQWVHWSEATAMPPVSDFFQHSMIRRYSARGGWWWIPAFMPNAGRGSRASTTGSSPAKWSGTPCIPARPVRT